MEGRITGYYSALNDRRKPELRLHYLAFPQNCLIGVFSDFIKSPPFVDEDPNLLESMMGVMSGIPHLSLQGASASDSIATGEMIRFSMPLQDLEVMKEAIKRSDWSSFMNYLPFVIELSNKMH